uniref:RRM domain-containing protein n=1 Tax=Amphiprion percula TaxID=161767 RepID=A0A3P8TY43_AMPPE
MWWLYVSGLSHTVTQKDLKDRFGKFGNKSNYYITAASLLCFSVGLTVLNKSKWKGGTLQTETAKENKRKTQNDKNMRQTTKVRQKKTKKNEKILQKLDTKR